MTRSRLVIGVAAKTLFLVGIAAGIVGVMVTGTGEKFSPDFVSGLGFIFGPAILLMLRAAWLDGRPIPTHGGNPIDKVKNRPTYIRVFIAMSCFGWAAIAFAIANLFRAHH